MAFSSGQFVTLSHTFTIDNFSQKKDVITSDTFAGPDEGVIWYLKVVPDNGKGYLSVFVCLHEQSEVSEIFASGCLAVLARCCNRPNCVWRAWQSHKMSFSKKRFGRSHIRTWGFSQFIQRAQLLLPHKHCVVNDRLIVACELDVASKYVPSMGNDLRPLDSLVELFETGDFGDCVISFGDHKRQIKVFKAILIACSPVFASMFDSNWKEGQLNKIYIRGVRYEVMRELIRYIYFGKVAGLKTIGKELLMAADMYELPNLKDVCVDSLLDSMKKEHVCEYVVIADRLHIDSLKIAAFKMFKAYASDIKQLPGWKDLLTQHPDLSVELIASLV
uniref:Uncharacterized protein n=1 Tax=Plectus sambesii TaxID=2011161 RepID=A0A914W9V2_9BILA